ncbi:hypothetical protein [Streptomyces fagopyri]|uniref:hypothetical protein n=1 Tax=Streptomyces fagopyri TaxID=2662397 RepID=UPI0033CE55A5
MARPAMQYSLRVAAWLVAAGEVPALAGAAAPGPSVPQWALDGSAEDGDGGRSDRQEPTRA